MKQHLSVTFYNEHATEDICIHTHLNDPQGYLKWFHTPKEFVYLELSREQSRAKAKHYGRNVVDDESRASCA